MTFFVSSSEIVIKSFEINWLYKCLRGNLMKGQTKFLIPQIMETKSQDSIRSCAMLTSFKLKSLILSPTSTTVAVALNDWEIFIPALNVGAENSLLLTAINTFMIRGASKMLKTKIAK